MMGLIRYSILSGTIFLFIFFLSCDDRDRYFLDEPSPHNYGSVGEELYRMIRRDLEDCENYRLERIAIFEAGKDRFIEAVDTILPEYLYDKAEAGLHQTLTYIDNGIIPRLTNNTVNILRSFRDDPTFINSIVSIKDGPLCLSTFDLYQLFHSVVSVGSPQYEGFIRFLVSLMKLVRDHNGKDDSGSLNSEDNRLVKGVQGLSKILKEIEIEEEETTFVEVDSTLLEKIIKEIGYHHSDSPRWIVVANEYGAPKLNLLGGIKPPFVDSDNDGKPDIDGRGNYIDGSGNIIELPPYDHNSYDYNGIRIGRDEYGRAIFDDFSLVYEYIDFNQTGLDSFLYGTYNLFESYDYKKLIDSINRFFGGDYRRERYKFLEPLSDLSYSVLDSLRYREAVYLLKGFATLFSGERELAKEFFFQAMEAMDIAKDYEIELNPENSLLDDLFPYLLILSDSGLIPKLIEVLDDPNLDNLPSALTVLMSYRDMDLSEYNSEFNEPVNRNGAESEYNRSLLQRLFHLVHDCYQARYVSNFGNLVFTIDDMAVFFLDSVADNARVPSYVVPFVDEFSDTTPTSWEVTLFVNHDHPILGNPVGREGRELRSYNGDTLFAFHYSGMKDAFKPIVKVFSDNGYTYLLAAIMSEIHEHYSTLAKYTTDMTREYDFYHVEKPAGLRKYEPLLIDLLEKTRLLNTALEFFSKIDTIIIDGIPMSEIVDRYFSELLYGELHLRRGEIIYNFDGVTPNLKPTHLHAIYQYLDKLLTVYDKETPQELKDSLKEIIEIVSDNYIDGPSFGGENEEKAEYLSYIIAKVLPILSEYVEQLERENSYEAKIIDWQNSIGEWKDKFYNYLEDETIESLVGLLNVIKEEEVFNADLRMVILELLKGNSQALSPSPYGRDNLERVARVVSGLRQTRFQGGELNNIKNKLIELLDFDRYPMDQIIVDLGSVLEYDPQSTALFGIKSLFFSRCLYSREFPGETIIELFSKLLKAEPQNPSKFGSEDVRAILDNIIYYFEDEHHGLKRLYEIVKHRYKGE